MTDRAPEQFSPISCDPLTGAKGEPLPFCATASTILTGAVRVDFHRHRCFRVGFLFGELIDLPSQLVRLLAIASSGRASSFGPDFAQPFKKQHAAGILRTDIGD